MDGGKIVHGRTNDSGEREDLSGNVGVCPMRDVTRVQLRCPWRELRRLQGHPAEAGNYAVVSVSSLFWLLAVHACAVDQPPVARLVH